MSVSFTAITTVSSVISPLGLGQTVTFTVTPTAAVTVTGGPQLLLSNGGIASYNATASTNTGLVFTYTVGNGRDTADLRVTGINPNGGNISGQATTAFDSPTAILDTSDYGLAVGDVNGDGKSDIVTVGGYYGNSTVSVLAGTSLGQFGPEQTYGVGNAPSSATIADVTGDGKADIVVANYGSDSISVLAGDGAGGFAPEQVLAVGSAPFEAVVGDVTGDGTADIVSANYGSDSMSILAGDGSGGFAAQQTIAVGSNPIALAVADVDGDGHTDIVVAQYGSASVMVLKGDGSGGFTAQPSLAVGDSPESVTLADVNGDGKLDIVTANTVDNTVSVLLNDGQGSFSSQQTYAVGIMPYAAVVADVNGDEKVDIITANHADGTVSVLAGDGQGGFAPQQVLSAGPNTSDVVVADVSNDGRPDILVTNDQIGSVTVLKNLSTNGGPVDFANFGNVAGVDTALVIDAFAPPALGTVVLAPASDTGAPGDDITNVSLPTFTGTAELGSTVRLYDGAVLIGTGTADPTTGAWSITATTALSKGANSLTATATDAAGNVSPASAALNVTLDTTLPTAPVISPPTLTNVAAPVLSGTAETGSVITFYEGEIPLGNASVAQDGTWSFTAGTLAEGLHQITASVADRAGNISPLSQFFALTVDTIPPNVTATLLNDSGSSASDRITADATLTGNGDPNATVTISEGANTLGTTVADAQGHWTFAPERLVFGVHNLVASEIDAAGNTSTVQVGLRLDPQSAAAPTDFITASPTNIGLVRFFDSVAGTQFYTSSLSEYNTILATRPDLKQEGNDLHALNPNNVATDADAVPVYRFFDSTYGTHFFTASSEERDGVIATRPDLKFEGVGFFEHTTQQAGDTAVYRFFDSHNGTHFYTTNETEKASILTTRPDLVSEGIGFYAPKIG